MAGSLSKETYIACLAALGVAWYLIATCFMHAPAGESQWPLFVVLLAGGAPLIFDLVRRMAAGQFGSDLLAGISGRSILTSAKYRDLRDDAV